MGLQAQSSRYGGLTDIEFILSVLFVLQEYWERQLANHQPVLNLQTDYRRPPVQTFAGAKVLCSMFICIVVIAFN